MCYQLNEYKNNLPTKNPFAPWLLNVFFVIELKDVYWAASKYNQ